MDNRKLGGHRRLTDQELSDCFNPMPEQPSRTKGFVRLLATWWHRWQERRQMAQDLPSFTDEVLQDFGLSRDKAKDLVNKPFWRA